MIKYTNDFASNLKILRKSRHLSQDKLADELDLSRSLIGMFESGKRKPSYETLELIADYFNVRLDDLSGRSSEKSDLFSISGIMPVPKMVKKPRLGTIACGEPILAEENFEGYDEIPDNIKCDFTLRCKGDSMIDARINNGDVVYIRQQSCVDNGDIAAVLIGDEATLKKVYIYDDRVVLQPANPKYEPMFFVKEDMNNVRIIGKAVGFTSKL